MNPNHDSKGRFARGSGGSSRARAATVRHGAIKHVPKIRKLRARLNKHGVVSRESGGFKVRTTSGVIRYSGRTGRIRSFGRR